ncbi:hypothetical protein ISN45_Aa01g030230 [Arabidopsis thaliana x Arabidopsis arenosa]|uniref:No apical meristem-associated C-terminal domain-containing protein n=1 Tax=Arabidopsis thaliana x Arabidopsis arenosa TaxID=1240361 RepID=A0A8T2CB88_9BRAS|nr:hypothetical protein ISN45_Aa01g030230 [Arabidopsis thaliana x Arabidopsis arenosa]
MNELIMKFAGCYEYASRTPRSREIEDDILVLAYKFYHQDQKTKFSLEHVWRILKTDQKWCNPQDFDVKERLSKKKLLDSFLGRSDGLSDMEIELKNTLIKEYLFGSNEFVSENQYSSL